MNVARAEKALHKSQAQRDQVEAALAELQTQASELKERLDAASVAAELKPSAAHEQAVADAQRALADLEEQLRRKELALSALVAEIGEASEHVKRAEADALEGDLAAHVARMKDLAPRWDRAASETLRIEREMEAVQEGTRRIIGRLASYYPEQKLLTHNGLLRATPFRNLVQALNWRRHALKGKNAETGVDWQPPSLLAALFERHSGLILNKNGKDKSDGIQSR